MLRICGNYRQLVSSVRMCIRSLVALCLLAAAATSVHAQSGANVLIVQNELSAESKDIAARYADARGIPAANILTLKIETVTEDIERRGFDARIEGPISVWFTRNNAHDRILYIVLTKGIPLRIRGTGGLNGTVASVDSELTLLYRKLLGLSVPPAGRVPNPFFAGDGAIDSAASAFSIVRTTSFWSPGSMHLPFPT